MFSRRHNTEGIIKKSLIMLVAAVIVPFFVSCSKVDASISDVVAVVEDSKMGVWLDAEVPSENNLVITVINPSGNLKWTVNAQTEEFEGVVYYGYTGFSMPDELEFESGNWTVELGCADGQVATASFLLP